jgi:putative peptidoglycan lipid II flippase
VSWLTYADRLMEFPVAMLGVALGVVLMPQLAAAKAAQDHERYSSMIDWGLRWVMLLGLPCAVALLVFATPIAAGLYHYGRFSATDVQHTALALSGYGFGLLGLVGIKILAPAYYAQHDIRTPVKIAIAVLIMTQLLNLIFVPWLQHAGLALAIGVGALINAGWLLAGLLRTNTYQPRPQWRRFVVQVVAACLCMGAALWWAAGAADWLALQAHAGLRVGLLTLAVLGAAGLYFLVLRLLGFKLKTFLRSPHASAVR